MRMLSGAVVVLAGAVLIGAGVISHAIEDAANKFTSSWTGLTTGAGVFVALIGLVILASGSPPTRHEERGHRKLLRPNEGLLLTWPLVRSLVT